MSSLGGVVHALWTLATPARFEPATPVAEVRVGHCLADIYLPAHPADAVEPFRSLVVVHGGAWVLGHRAMKPTRLLARRLIDRGVAVVSVDYRLLGQGAIRLADQVHDVRAALRWWRDAAPRWGADPGRITVAGASAGGTLALLALSEEPPETAAQAVGLFGAYDLSSLGGLLGATLPPLLFHTRDRSHWRARSPIVRHCPQPLTMLHGTADRLVPYRQAQALDRARADAGLATTLHSYEGAEHAFFNHPDNPHGLAAVEHLYEALA